MSFECQVRRRYPVTVAVLSGTLDRSAAAEGARTLQGCLADEQPVEMVLDVAALAVTGPSAVAPLADLARSARRWPGTVLAVSGASPEVRRGFADVSQPEPVEFFPSAREAFADGLRRPLPARVSCDLQPTVYAPATCRELIAGVCREWRITGLQRRAQLVASELVTNAVEHAGTPMSVSVRYTGAALQVAVRDGERRTVLRPPPEPAGLPLADLGRGLLLLETLADDWGCVPTSDGKVVWACVAPPPQRG